MAYSQTPARRCNKWTWRVFKNLLPMKRSRNDGECQQGDITPANQDAHQDQPTYRGAFVTNLGGYGPVSSSPDNVSGKRPFFWSV